ncbi:DNA ligase [Hydrogenophaga electricum]|uniref:ATP-dependent DNA ligase n=1 Tax=Hydrogenophaga electricum TaxID=1230953 RepID=A0ABQ6BYX7_9BURK|nr:DNA ligase [Hydrogenophaga electricum]GLS13363.1 ATP-dependent DNA ligase [Hydrogenophaga electricum]
MIRRRALVLLLACLASLTLSTPGHAQATDGTAPTRPALMLANVYHPSIDISAYWVSEKYDGVRGYWNGRQLITRGGEAIQAPAWFTAGWPTEAMDGELWAGRGQFEWALSTVRRQTPDDDAWRRIRFMVFDLPDHPGVFDERLAHSQTLIARAGQPWLEAVPQTRVRNRADLMARLDRAVLEGAEGLMLHRGDAPYRGLRSDDLLKLKTHDDAEAQVLEHLPGQGKYTGQMGALLVRTPDGRRFRLGSGFTDTQRREPPAIGTWVTYRFRGLHGSGLPRFASFVRERPNYQPEAAETAR